MTNLEKYIELMTKGVRLMASKTMPSIESEELFKQIQLTWDDLTEEEKVYADEQTLRTQLYVNPQNNT